MSEVETWVEDSPYSSFLGMQLESCDAQSARLLLPYRDEKIGRAHV